MVDGAPFPEVNGRYEVSSPRSTEGVLRALSGVHLPGDPHVFGPAREARLFEKFDFLRGCIFSTAAGDRSYYVFGRCGALDSLLYHAKTLRRGSWRARPLILVGSTMHPPLYDVVHGVVA